MGFAGKMQKQSQQPFNGVRSSRWEHHISCDRPKREDSLTLFHFQVFVHFNEFPVKYKYSLDLMAVWARLKKLGAMLAFMLVASKNASIALRTVTVNLHQFD